MDVKQKDELASRSEKLLEEELTREVYQSWGRSGLHIVDGSWAGSGDGHADLQTKFT